MIGYLEGTLKQLDATRALVLAGGVGYEVHISLQTYYKLEGQKTVSLQIYTHVREDALSLYGFASGATVFVGSQVVEAGGSVSGTVINNGITETVSAGGSATGLIAGAGASRSI